MKTKWCCEVCGKEFDNPQEYKNHKHKQDFVPLQERLREEKKIQDEEPIDSQAYAESIIREKQLKSILEDLEARYLILSDVVKYNKNNWERWEPEFRMDEIDRLLGYKPKARSNGTKVEASSEQAKRASEIKEGEG